MSLNYVELTLDLDDGQGNPVTTGTAFFIPTVQLTNAGVAVTTQAPVPAVFHAGGQPVVKLLATDSSGPLPAGWAWTVSFSGVPGNPAPFTFFLPFASGASQFLSSQAPVSSAVTMQAYLPLGGGTLTGPLSYPGALNLKAAPFSAAGDGVTDDSAAVQAWLNALAASPGSRGYVPPGTYLVGTSPALTGASNFTIDGAGRAAIFKAKAATQPNVFQFTNCSRVIISGIAIDGNRANVTQLGTQYTALNGIYLQGCDDVTIEGCYIHDVYVSGIMANGGCTNLMISRCRLVNCGDNQIYIRAQNTAPYTICSSVTVTGCICSGGSFSGIQGLGSSYLTFTGNVCYGNGPTAAQGNGIGSEGCSYVTITGNVCYSNGIQGIQSRFTNEVGSSIQSQHVVISGNTVYGHTSGNGDAGGIGINDTDDITVSGNLCYGNYYGINVNGGNGLGVSHLQLASNSVRGSLNAGIRLAPGSGSDYLLQDNYVTDSAADNLFCSAPVTVQGGYYRRASGTHQGIHLSSGSGGSLIAGADISNNTDNGILIDAGVGPADIRNCWFNGSGTDQNRSVQEQATGGPTLMVNCRVQNQKTNLYVFNNAASRFVNEGAAAANFKPANPASTTSTTLVMMGVGSACVYTPAGSGKVFVSVTAYGNNSAAGPAGITCGPRYGTGTAPVNGAAVSGTRFGGATDPGSRPGGTGSGAGVAFAFTDLLTLTAGTAYWFDLSLLTGNVADAASLINISMTFAELS